MAREQKVTEDEAELMVMEILRDLDNEALGKILAIALNAEVKALPFGGGFKIIWSEPKT